MVEQHNNSRLRAAGELIRGAIEDITKDFVEVRDSIKSEQLDPQDLNKLAKLSGEIAKGTATASPCPLGEIAMIYSVAELSDQFPSFKAGPVLPSELLEDVVFQYRSLGFSAIGCISENVARVFYDPTQSSGEFSFAM